MPIAYGYAAVEASAPLAPFTFERRAPGPRDVKIRIDWCGVCHSDLHTARGEWGNTLYPSVPGHEIIGEVTEVGAEVTKHRPGDIVGVGCMVDSCRACASCRSGLEQYCEAGFTGTYNGPEQGTGANTYGGYSNTIVVDESFVLRIPPGLDPAGAAPLLCAGVTTYSPLRRWRVAPGNRVGVVGLGGLGHMAVKLARAMGAEVILFTNSPEKVADGLAMGAHEVVISKDPDAMSQQRERIDFIINTVAAPHNLDAYLECLTRDGTMVLVGAPASPHPSPSVFNLIMKRRQIAGSLIGGIAETQEMLDFCATHKITCEIETIPIQAINEAYERMLRGDVHYRFVIDMRSLKGS
jgi:alcohol dehydrogenase (NADP+)